LGLGGAAPLLTPGAAGAEEHRACKGRGGSWGWDPGGDSGLCWEIIYLYTLYRYIWVYTGIGQPYSCDSPAVNHFAAIVGGLMYFANTTRLDLSFAASALACFMSKPTDNLLSHARHVVRYLASTRELCLVLGAAEQRDALHGVYSDSNFADDQHTFRSVAGIAVLYSKSLLLWRSVKMLDIAKSTTTAEYIAASMASDEVMFTQSILSELGMLVPTTDLYVDNNAATMILERPRVDHKTKYLGLHWHYVQERVSGNEIRVVWVPTNENTADLFTKSLGGQLLKKHCTALGMK
jgi:hypothetical protein